MVKIHPLFSHLYDGEKMCRSIRGSAFFGAQLRLRSFGCALFIHGGKKNEKLVSLLLTLALMVSLVACGGGSETQAAEMPLQKRKLKTPQEFRLMKACSMLM